MHIFNCPTSEAVARLLQQAELPTADIAQNSAVQLYAVGTPDDPHGVVGIERCGDTALLRSLAVRPDKRGAGIASALVSHAEAQARHFGVARLYLLTATAHDFFARRGYVDLPREEAPPAIRRTREFSALCPATAAFMAKPLLPAGYE